MSSKDKEAKSFQDKLKQMFKGNKGNIGNFKTRELGLREDVERELNSNAPLQVRLKAIKSLNEVVLTNKLEDTAVEKIWHLTKDLVESDKSADIRQQTFQLFKNLIDGQKDRLGLMRAQFFRFIEEHNNPEDVVLRFELLRSLTDDGKDVCYFEESIGPFLLEWLPDVVEAGKAQEYLHLLVRVIKFNAAYLTHKVITGLIQRICILSCNTRVMDHVIKACLEVLDTIVAYSNLPSDSLAEFVGVLCRVVNGEAFCHTSWKIMRNLLGTHMGHSALFTMCRILQEPCLCDDAGLLRGAIFYIKMGLWGNQNLTNLNCPPSVILESFLQCINHNKNPIVIYEMTLAVQNLISKQGQHLHEPAWNIILSILLTIVKDLKIKKTSPTTEIAKHLHEILTSIETFVEKGKYNGSIKEFYDVIEECSAFRPENSVSKLIAYLAQDVTPIRHKWLTQLNNLLNGYFKNETRTNIRLRALDVLYHTVDINRRQYGDELLDKIVIPHLTNTYLDQDVLVRTESVKLLIDVCSNCESKRCLDVLDVLEKVLNRPFTVNHDGKPWSDSDVTDVKEVVKGLIEVFTIKIHKLPSAHSIRIFKMFVRHLEMHYERPKILEHCSAIRCNIFEYFVKIRADTDYHLGCPDSRGTLQFSTYLCVTYKNTEKCGALSSPPPPQPTVVATSASSTVIPQQQQPSCTVTYISMIRAFKVVITCLRLERDWKVLSLVLQELPKVLQNKTLILSKHENNEVGILVNRLCEMITEKTVVDMKITKSDLHAAVLPVLSSLASYHAYLEPCHQQQMIRCLYKFCIGPRSSRHCITALTTCTLEMSEVMVKMLPDVLLTLSKISATIHIAIPILEFLSTITILPHLYASFIGDQYMAIFAISLPYTNPFKYNHYTVSLAHHVIAVWFLKCRLPLRKDFVRFIMSGLQTNALVPFEETNALKVDLSKLNQDSSDRKRSSSLTEQTSRSRERTATIAGRMDKTKFDFKPQPDKALHTFYEELTETCIDLMARYTYSPCSALPRRLPTAEFLLNGGQSMSWLLGNKVITITTSGCAQKALKRGLCDKCYNACKAFDQPKTPDDIRLVGGNLDARDDHLTSGNRMTSRQNSGEKSTTSAGSPLEENKRFPLSLADKLETLPSKLQQLSNVENTKHVVEQQRCACWCQSWAEIHIRRPTGDMSWVMRIQNQISSPQTMYDFPLNELTKLFASSTQFVGDEDNQTESRNERAKDATIGEEGNDEMEEERSATSNPISIPGSPNKYYASRQSSRDSCVDDDEDIDDDTASGAGDGTGKSRNPVRRSNSSPEMSANWKNPFAKQDSTNSSSGDTQNTSSNSSSNNGEEETCKKKAYGKDMRVSCEAIPEEIGGSGTTPPGNEDIRNQPQGDGAPGQSHPALLSCHSYPGLSQSKNTNQQQQQLQVNKPYQTVPQSPAYPTSATSPPPLFPSNRGASTMMKTKSSSTESNSSDKGNDRPAATSNLPANLVPLRSKPPQSPTQTSPRFSRHAVTIRDKDGHEIQKSSSLVLEKTARSDGRDKRAVTHNPYEKSASTGAFDAIANNQRRDRGYTISVMSPVRKPGSRHAIGANPTTGTVIASSSSTSSSARTKETPKSGINPSFVFLQLYHHVAQGGSSVEKPLSIDSNEVVQRALKVLDCIPPYETHKIGVIYIGNGQCNNETEILRNRFGSVRYVEFLHKLGTLIKLQDVDPQVYFLGGLERNGADGKFSYIWQDDIIRVMFHVATLMPNKETDPNCTNKKLHIGNNNVTIVYNESGEEYNINTIKGQFNFASIIVQPLDHNTNKVTVKAKDDLADLICNNNEPNIVSDQNVSVLARQLAIHANLASLVFNSLKSRSQDPYASNWLERLRKIKNLRNKIIQESKKETVNQMDDSFVRSRKGQMDDFTEYT